VLAVFSFHPPLLWEKEPLAVSGGVFIGRMSVSPNQLSRNTARKKALTATDVLASSFPHPPPAC